MNKKSMINEKGGQRGPWLSTSQVGFACVAVDVDDVGDLFRIACVVCSALQDGVEVTRDCWNLDA